MSKYYDEKVVMMNRLMFTEEFHKMQSCVNNIYVSYPNEIRNLFQTVLDETYKLMMGTGYKFEIAKRTTLTKPVTADYLTVKEMRGICFAMFRFNTQLKNWIEEKKATSHYPSPYKISKETLYDMLFQSAKRARQEMIKVESDFRRGNASAIIKSFDRNLKKTKEFVPQSKTYSRYNSVEENKQVRDSIASYKVALNRIAQKFADKHIQFNTPNDITNELTKNFFATSLFNDSNYDISYLVNSNENMKGAAKKIIDLNTKVLESFDCYLTSEPSTVALPKETILKIARGVAINSRNNYCDSNMLPELSIAFAETYLVLYYQKKANFDFAIKDTNRSEDNKPPVKEKAPDQLVIPFFIDYEEKVKKPKQAKKVPVEEEKYTQQSFMNEMFGNDDSNNNNSNNNSNNQTF